MRKMTRHNIYYIRFKFSDKCVFPTISMRTNTTLIQPLEHPEFASDSDDGDWLPVWGDTVITAMTCDPECRIFVNRYI